MLICDGHVAELSVTEPPQSWLESTANRVDLEGRTVLPGLWDAHIHLGQYAQSLHQLDLELPSLQDCLERVRAAAECASPGQWILGHGWNQNSWERYGTAFDLDRVAPQNPVYLTAKSLHAAWVNSRALEAAGIGADSPDPPDGYLGRRENGTPNGLLFEGAMRLVSSRIDPPSPQTLAGWILTALNELLAVGITGIHDFDDPRCFQALQILREQGNLPLRVLKHLQRDNIQKAFALGLRTGFGDDFLRLGNIKLFADGALGPRTAAMLHPYSTDPDNSGNLLLGRDEIVHLGIHAAEQGLALAVHAIGDRANREVLDAFEALRAWEAENAICPLPHRVEHLQILHPDDIQRVGELRLVASMQPIHAISDMTMAEEHWGPRVRWAYAWQSILQGGAMLIFGSDAPVEPPNPFLGLYAAITRHRLDGSPPEGWIPAERLDLWEALACYTWRPAKAAYTARPAGRLAPGSYADLIVLDEDLFEIEPRDLANLRPTGVMTNGEWRVRAF